MIVTRTAASSMSFVSKERIGQIINEIGFDANIRGEKLSISDFCALADKLYEELLAKGVEVIYDDRNISAGVMFSDADLLGVPIRVVVSPRNLKAEVLEVSFRDKSYSDKISIHGAIEALQELIKKAK